MVFEKVVSLILDCPITSAFGVVVCVVIYGLVQIRKNFQPGTNPFANDFRRAKEPLMTDQRQRDAILKPSKIFPPFFFPGSK